MPRPPKATKSHEQAFSIQDAEKQMSRLLKRVSAGEEITLLKGGKAVAKLVPLTKQELIEHQAGHASKPLSRS